MGRYPLYTRTQAKEGGNFLDASLFRSSLLVTVSNIYKQVSSSSSRSPAAELGPTDCLKSTEEARHRNTNHRCVSGGGI